MQHNRDKSVGPSRFAAGVVFMGGVVMLLVFSLVTFMRNPVPAGEIKPRDAGTRLDINTADAAALSLLPGIGPAIADRIVEYREKVGPFRSPDDLANVSGIGKTTVDNIRPYVVCHSQNGPVGTSQPAAP